VETANARVASTPLSVGGTGLCAEALDGRFARLTDGIRRALGYDPRTTSATHEAAVTYVWDRAR